MAKAKKAVVKAVVKASKRTEKKPSKAKKLAAEASAVGAKTRKRRKQESEGDDLPPDEAEIESQTLDTDKLVAEVERIFENIRARIKMNQHFLHSPTWHQSAS